MEILDQPTNTPELRKADAGNRIVAYLIDSLIMIPLAFIPFLGLIAIVAYGLTKDALPFLDGQSIGKKAMGLRVVTLDGQPITNNWSASIVRGVVLMIPFFPLVELIVMLTNQDQYRLGDQWAKTRVISVK